MPGAARSRPTVCFTDRTEHVERWEKLLAGVPPEGMPVLEFYGVAGSGKRTLIGRFQELCSERRIPAVRVDLGEAKGTEAALSRMAGALEKQHRLKLQRFQRVLAALAARAGGDSQLGMVAPVLDLALDSLSLIPVVGPFTFVVKLGRGAIDSAFERAMENPSFRTAALRLGGQQELLELLDTPEEELRSLLLERFVEELSAGNRRAALFFEGHDAPGAETAGVAVWLRELAERLAERGHLVAITGTSRLDWPAPLLEERPLEGFASSDAEAFLRACTGTDDLPCDVIEAILEATNEAADGEEPRHHCFLLALCAEILLREHRRIGRVPGPEAFRTVHHAGSAGDQLAGRFLDSLPSEMSTWLEELSLAPRFDEKFALELDAARHHGNRRAGWRQLRRLTLLEERERGFVEIHRLLREALRARVEPEDAEEIHAWAYEFWTERARQDWQEHGYYSLEQPRWQEVVRLSFHHLCRSGERLRRGRAELRFVRLVLDVYWWWCENLPLQFWTQLLQTTEAALQSTTEESDRWAGFLQVVRRLREFEAAWPKGWLKEPEAWDAEVCQQWGDAAVDGWSWRTCQDRLRALLRDLRLEETYRRIGSGSVEDVDELEGHVAALIAYYLGKSGHHRALELARAGDATAAEACREEAERAFRVLETWFTQREAEPLQAAWSRILLGDLYRTWDRETDADSATNEALSTLGGRQREVGAAMEGAADAHRVRAELELQRDRPFAAGAELARALVYAIGFHATDQDDYCASYLRDLRRQAERLLREQHALDQERAARFLAGFREQWLLDPALAIAERDTELPQAASLLQLLEELNTLAGVLPRDPSETEYAAAREWFEGRCRAFGEG